MPKVKLITLLRNPIDRAWSHYWQSVRKKRETLSFEEAIRNQMQEEKISGNVEVIKKNNYKINLNQYLSGGIYVDRIKKYLDIFSNEQILILQSENFYNEPQSILDRISEFLNISKWKPKNYTKFNFHEEQPNMDKTLRKELVEYYQPHNKKLYKYLGRNFNWDF